MLSFQLYSSREVPSQAAFLGDLAAMGYGAVEGYGGVYGDPQGFAAALEQAGLTMPSGHFGLDQLEGDLTTVLSTARSLGMTSIFAPYLDASLRPTDAAGYTDLAGRLAALGQTLAGEGFGFGWHNHDFELVPLADGSVPLDILLGEAPDIAWEADLAWVIRGAADPATYIDRYGTRIAAVHVKDIAPEGQNTDEDGWSDLGQGVVDWGDLVARVRAARPGALMIMEHDKPSDAHRFAQTSLTHFNTFEGAPA